MPLIDTNHQRAALVVLLLGVAIVIALSPYATGLIGIPVLYAIFAPVYEWLCMRMRPRLAASLVVVLALFLIVVPGVSFAGLIVNQAQGIAAGVIQSPLLGRLKELKPGGIDLGPRLADLGARVVAWIGSSAFGLIGTATRLALNLTISLFGLFYLLLRPHDVWEAVQPYIPFSAKNTEKLRQRFRDVTTSTIIGTGVTAAIQGLLVGLGFWVTGLPNAVFWGVVTMVFAILPVVFRDSGPADRAAGAQLLLRAREDVPGGVPQLALLAATGSRREWRRDVQPHEVERIDGDVSIRREPVEVRLRGPPG